MKTIAITILVIVIVFLFLWTIQAVVEYANDIIKNLKK